MPNTFKSNVAANIITAGNTVYTCPAATQTVVIGCSVANKSTINANTSVYLRRVANNYTIISGASVNPGSSLVVIGGDQKLVLQVSDAIFVTSSNNATLDCIVSVLEIS